jgi:MFS family permease
MRARLFTPENRKWWTLVAVAVGLFMIMLDNTVVNVALPSIQQDLGIGSSGAVRSSSRDSWSSRARHCGAASPAARGRSSQHAPCKASAPR